MVFRTRIGLVAALAALAGGCGDENRDLPDACRAVPDEVLAALGSAPRPVELAGTRLSECLTRAGEPGDLERLGAAWVEVAARLADAARRDPRGPAAMRLGYLIGAAREGASRTQGIHDELLRRLDQELTGISISTGSYPRGFEAGRDRG